jgi:hypothetical protein
MGYAHNETSGQQNRCGQVSKPYNYQRTKLEQKLSSVSRKVPYFDLFSVSQSLCGDNARRTLTTEAQRHREDAYHKKLRRRRNRVYNASNSYSLRNSALLSTSIEEKRR